MIIDFLSDWKNIVYAAVTTFFGAVWWSLKKRFVPSEELAALQKQILESNTARDARITALEAAIAQLPTTKEINALRAQLTEVAGELKVFNHVHANTNEKIGRLQLQTDRIERFLMEKKS